MSKKLFMGFALALALVGCSQEEELVNMSGEPLKDLTGEIVEAGSRTHLGSDGSVLWSAGDKISLFKKTGYHQSYQVKSEGVGKSSTGFEYIEGGPGYSNYSNDLHYAVYPFDADHQINSSEKKLTLDLSSLATQSYTNNTFENGKAVMVAKSATTQLAFTNAFSLANVQLTGEVNNVPGDDIFVNSIILTSKKKALAGTATVDMNQDKPIAVFDNDNGLKTITLDCGTDGIQLTATATDFYILMPAVTFPAGDLTVTINATVAGEAKVYSSTLNEKEAPFQRSKVTTLPGEIKLDGFIGSTEATIKNVENVTAANDALQNNTGVDIADATGATESTPITVPAKTEEDEAAKEHTIDLSDATMPTGTPVYIKVEEGDASNHTVETLKVIVPEDTTPSDFTINAPGTTVTLTTANGSMIGTIIAETADETLVISSGITVNKVNVKKGNVKLEAGAIVKEIVRNENNKDEATYVIYEGNTKPTITINNEYIILVPAAELENYMVAQIGNKKYLSLQKAVEAVQNGETIVVLKDIKQKDGVLITDKNLTIDLNDKTFTVTEGASTNNRNLKINGSSVVTIMNGTMVAAGEYSSGAYGTLRTEGTAKVTLEDVKLYNYRGNGLNVKAYTGTNVTITDSEVYSQYGGGIEAAGGIIELNNVTIDQKGVYSGAAWCSVAIGVNGGGKVTVNSGNYSASAISTDSNAAQGTWAAYVMSSGGTLEINGGTFNGTVAETASAANACGLICADAKAVVNIKGGTFNSNGAILDMRNNTGGTPNPKAILTGGTFSADPRVSGLYSSNLIQIAEGYKVVENSGVWTVEIDPAAKIGETKYASLQEAFNVGGEITLLRNVTLAETAVLAEGKTAVLDLNGKTITTNTKDGYAINNDKGGTLTIKDTKETGNIYGVVYTETGSTTIEGGTFNPVEGGTFVLLNYQGTLIINNATINGGSSYPIYSYDADNKLIINDVTVNATFGCVNAYGLGGTVEINGGTFQMTGVQGKTSHIAYFSNVDATINGGTFEKIGDINMSGAGGGGICAIYGANLTINGGNFAGDYADVYNWGGTNANGRATAFTIKGGSYKFKPSNIAEGYVAVNNSDGTWSVGAEVTLGTQIK